MSTVPKNVDYRHWCDLNKSIEATVDTDEATLSGGAKLARPVELEITCSRYKRLGRLKLHIVTSVILECQRCLEPFEFGIDASIEAFLVGEHEIEYVDDDEDYLVHNSEGCIDIIKIVQDEIELVLPMVAKHPDEQCQPKTVFGELHPEAKSESDNPFAVLTDLKKRT
tara:strand:+ start:789 stop:1292 length:504 start_codon:yes stop_codon:yes gene_type:complete